MLLLRGAPGPDNPPTANKPSQAWVALSVQATCVEDGQGGSAEDDEATAIMLSLALNEVRLPIRGISFCSYVTSKSHYVAYVLVSGEWYRCDNQFVWPIDGADIPELRAYISFYKRRSLQE